MRVNSLAEGHTASRKVSFWLKRKSSDLMFAKRGPDTNCTPIA